MSRDPCSSCAFKSGSVTNSEEPHNVLTGALCVMGAIPFYCHEPIDWRSEEANSLMRDKIKKGEAVICEGWKREVKKVAATGYYKRVGVVLKAYAHAGILLMSEAIESKGKKKKEAWRKFSRIVRVLKKHRQEVLKERTKK